MRFDNAVLVTIINGRDDNDEDDKDNDEDDIAVAFRLSPKQSTPKTAEGQERTKGGVHPWWRCIDQVLDDGSVKSVIQRVIKVIERH